MTEKKDPFLTFVILNTTGHLTHIWMMKLTDS